MADAETRSPAPEGRSRRAARWWLAAATFVVGLFAGAILVGLLSEGSSALPAAGPAAGPTPSEAAGPTSAQPTSPAAGATAELVVNDACLRALNAAQDIYRSVNDLGEAASQLNAARLDEVIRQLQPLQGRLRENIDDCHVATRLPNGSLVDADPSLSSAAAPTS
ncbi:hypothetical protein SAMN05661080_01648 [Modestobacter sp. DSM 44400]|uniref:hypothetical protein n=1 Tax=Modestobacter sp. DSM 44400 TaxID=1550230 RepID=UPI00089B22D6|nr:hypothetical protein [Modestobacter sp. DSM 44400]SDX90519.1 hypothetical protein SAMN05661080_01648 [Modestobacter sp. DSM 44400]